jgi:hypothetical protein
MKNLNFLISIITALTNGMFKIIKDKVIPIIHFIETIKSLIENDDFLPSKKKTDKDKDPVKTDWIVWLVKTLSWSEETFKKFSKAFISSLKKLLPDVITGSSFLIVLEEFVEHLRTLNNTQKAFLFFKLASLMLIALAPEKKFQETESDFIIQLVYTREKMLNNI